MKSTQSAERDDLVFKMRVAGLSFQPSWQNEGLLFIAEVKLSQSPNRLHFTDATIHLERVSSDLSASDCLGTIQRTFVFTGLIQSTL